MAESLKQTMLVLRYPRDCFAVNKDFSHGLAVGLLGAAGGYLAGIWSKDSAD